MLRCTFGRNILRGVKPPLLTLETWELVESFVLVTLVPMVFIRTLQDNYIFRCLAVLTEVGRVYGYYQLYVELNDTALYLHDHKSLPNTNTL